MFSCYSQKFSWQIVLNVCIFIYEIYERKLSCYFGEKLNLHVYYMTCSRNHRKSMYLTVNTLNLWCACMISFDPFLFCSVWWINRYIFILFILVNELHTYKLLVRWTVRGGVTDMFCFQWDRLVLCTGPKLSLLSLS